MKKRCKELIALQGSHTSIECGFEEEYTWTEIYRFLKYTKATITYRDGTLYHNNKMRLGKFLNNCGFNPDEVSTYCEAIKPQTITISCRFKDILAATNTPHFESCFSPEGENRYAVNEILKDPYVAVALRRDSSGKVMGRMWLRLCLKKSFPLSFNLLTYRTYGNLSKIQVRQILQAKLPDNIYLTDCAYDCQPIQPIYYYDDCGLRTYK